MVTRIASPIVNNTVTLASTQEVLIQLLTFCVNVDPPFKKPIWIISPKRHNVDMIFNHTELLLSFSSTAKRLQRQLQVLVYRSKCRLSVRLKC